MELRAVSPTAKAPSSNFAGDVYVNPIYRGEEPSRMIVSLVRFTPGVHTNLHSAMLEGTENGDSTTWLEPVADEQYAAANQS